MSLTANDLQAIREIVKDEVSTIVRNTVKEVLGPINGELEALRNDIQEIYDMLADSQSKATSNKEFQKLSLEQKLIKLNSELLSAAKQAGITLPR
jgi:cell shape-determining protein MreC